MDARQIFMERHAALHAAAMHGDGWWKAAAIYADLPEEQVRCRPTPQHNSIAWLLWHMARCEDVAVNTLLRGCDEVLDRDGWLPQLGITSRHIGTGATCAEVDAISQAIDLAALRAYWVAVGQETQTWASTLDFDMLGKIVTAEEVQRVMGKGDLGEDAGWVGPFWVNSAWTYATFLFWLAIEHNWFHLGETWVIRGMLTQPIR